MLNKVNFFFLSGTHYLLKSHLSIQLPELFRWTMVDITFQPLNQKEFVELIIKTSGFYIFVSKSLEIRNIRLVGNDVSIISNEGQCSSLSSDICCQDKNLYLISDNPCYVDKEKSEVGKEGSLLGLFNLEFIFDQNISPNITINNCEIFGFYSLQLNKGFFSIISIAPFGGNVQIIDLKMTDCYFPGGIISFPNNMNEFYNDNTTKINNKFKDNIKERKESYLFSNIKIYNYNDLFQQEIALKSTLIDFKNSEGNLHLIDSSFENISNTNLIKVSSLLTDISFILQNSVIKNITECSIIATNQFSGLIQISNISLNALKGSSASLIEIKKGNDIMIRNLSVQSAKMIDSSLISFVDTIATLENTNFYDISCFSIVSQSGFTLKIKNSTFNLVVFKLGLIFIDNSVSTQIETSIFGTAIGEFATFYITNSKLILLVSSIIQNCTLSSIFYSDHVQSSYSFDLIIQYNNLRSIWNDDQTVDKTFAKQTQLKSNYFSSCMYVNYGISDAVINLEEFYIYLNKLETFAFVSMFVGTINMEKMFIIYNIYIDPSLFQMSFDLETTTLTRLTNSYIENIGVDTKKNFYIGIEDNNVVSFWYTDYSYLNNVVFVVTNRIELSSGFISGSPIGIKLDIFNCKFIKIGENNLFGYKGMLLDSVADLNILNSTFHNIPCNKRTFTHAHGVIYVTGSSGYLYSKNDFNINFHNNSFYNCSCIYGGNVAIVSINTINITNCYFYNSSSTYFGGSFLIISSPNVYMHNLTIDKSIGNEGGAIFLKNIFKSEMNNVTIKNSMARRSGVVYLNNVNELVVENCQSYDTLTNLNGGVMYIFHSSAIISNTMIINSAANEGGAFFLHGKSNVYFDNIFISNSSAIQAGGISVYEVNNFRINNSLFIKVFAKLEGAACF